MSWPEIRPGRLGTGVVLDADVLWALRVGEDRDHDRVVLRIASLAKEKTPLVVSFQTLASVADRLQTSYGYLEAVALLKEADAFFNVVPSLQEDIDQALDLLFQGVERLTVEQAVAGVMAKRLGCSIYGSSPAYHLLHLAVVVD